MTPPPTLAAWRRADAVVVRFTRLLLFLLGSIFVVAVCVEVASRLFFELSLYFLHSLTLFLLVWFFLLGAGLALREGAHVGFDLVVKAMPPAMQRLTLAIGYAAVLAFFALMIWSGLATLAPALEQTDASLGISVFWIMLAFPIGFGLMIYHQIAAIMLGPLEASG